MLRTYSFRSLFSFAGAAALERLQGVLRMTNLFMASEREWAGQSRPLCKYHAVRR
ncbi:hypothetical protein [Sedimentitalea sp.]|uniref:hypothetical protein n=1 Tax=Sedimentitalea sp. TaxID=2048915 RepID=UPI003298920D